MDGAVALALDHRRVVVGDPQCHLRAERLGQVLDEGLVALGHARGVLGRDDGQHQFRILGGPALRLGGVGQSRAAGGKGGAQHETTGEHGCFSLRGEGRLIRSRRGRSRAGRPPARGRGWTRSPTTSAGFQAVEVVRDGVGERSGCAVEHHAARRHADQPVAVFARQVEAVQVADHGDAEVAVDVEQRVHHHLGVARIERGDRLVGQDDLGLLDQRAGDGDPLLLAARERVGALAGQAGHVEALQRRQRLRLLGVVPQLKERARGRHVEGAAHHDVGQHVEPAGEVELLEDHGAARPPVAQLAARQRGDIGVAEQRCGRSWDRPGG